MITAAASQGMPVPEIVARARAKPSPRRGQPLEEGSVAWYAAWLARRASFAFLDSVVRGRDHKFVGLPTSGIGR